MSAQQGGTLALKALRRKFIFTNMLFVVIVLAIMCAVMTATTMHQRTNEVYDALEPLADGAVAALRAADYLEGRA